MAHPTEFSNGQIETLKVPQLPPTPITPSAYETLLKWGLSDTQIQQLREFTAQFRYDLCQEKVEAIVRKKAYSFTEDDKQYLLMPEYYDTREELDRECGVIAKKWIQRIEDTGLFIDIQNNGKKITLTYYEGYADVFFINDEQNHIWTGLVLQNEKGTVLDEIYIDASLQKICTIAESKYREKSFFNNPSVEHLIHDAVIAVGFYEVLPNNEVRCWLQENVESNDATLGISSNFEYTFSIGFFQNIETETIKPVIFFTDKLATVGLVFISEDNVLRIIGRADRATIVEMKEMIMSLQNLPILSIEYA